ncbi:hypothetical protein Tsubulata_028387 [Turnera subulata]|uniref:Laccase n=1 Tax=Turnera subulata TaxID=218843 RepID=A0A9Q0J5B1_9ROSI|nr:hypothetical protein Tsubulata_028387 [Turnera subulata]
MHHIDVVPGKTYLLTLINAALNMEVFFGIAEHKLAIVEADAEYTKPLTTDRVMLGPGQTMNVLVTADQRIGKYSMAVGPYMSARNVAFQNITAVAYFQYLGALPNSLSLPAKLPRFNDNLAVKTIMSGLRGLDSSKVPKEIDTNLFVTVGLNVNKCRSKNPKQNCQSNNGTMAASMNNISFIKPPVSILEAYYKGIEGAKVVEYGSRVQIILQDTGTVTTENHPIHLHGYSFFVVGFGTGNYNPQTASLNLVDPPCMNTIGVPVGGWAAIRFKADNQATVLIVKNGIGHLETLPHPPADLPRC